VGDPLERLPVGPHLDRRVLARPAFEPVDTPVLGHLEGERLLGAVPARHVEGDRLAGQRLATPISRVRLGVRVDSSVHPGRLPSGPCDDRRRDERQRDDQQDRLQYRDSCL